MANPWKVTDNEIQALWTEIWPKIVAIMWLDDYRSLKSPASYRSCFERDEDFRRDEVQRIAKILLDYGILRATWTSNIPICLTDPKNLGIIMSQYADQANCLDPRHTILDDNSETGRGFKWSCPATLYGETFFYVNQKGIVLPWPNRPSLHAIFIGYAEGGGALPRTGLPVHDGPPLWNMSPLIPTEKELYEKLIDIPWPKQGCEGPESICYSLGLSGVALLTLFEKWSEVVGGAWTYGAKAADQIRDNLEDYVKPEVWTHLPSLVELKYWDRHTFMLEGDSDKKPQEDSIRMWVPVPAPTNDPGKHPQHVRTPFEPEIFQELIVGHATNPMYSNCY